MFVSSAAIGFTCPSPRPGLRQAKEGQSCCLGHVCLPFNPSEAIAAPPKYDVPSLPVPTKYCIRHQFGRQGPSRFLPSLRPRVPFVAPPGEPILLGRKKLWDFGRSRGLSFFTRISCWGKRLCGSGAFGDRKVRVVAVNTGPDSGRISGLSLRSCAPAVPLVNTATAATTAVGRLVNPT